MKIHTCYVSISGPNDTFQVTINDTEVYKFASKGSRVKVNGKWASVHAAELEAKRRHNNGGKK